MKLFNAIAAAAVIGTSFIAANPANANSQCSEQSIMKPTPFMGNHGEVFKLSDGSWKEVVYSYEYLYAYYPRVVVCDNDKMYVEGKKINYTDLE